MKARQIPCQSPVGVEAIVRLGLGKTAALTVEAGTHGGIVVEAFEAPGRWWLPSNPDDRLSGTLVCDSEGNLTLKMIGAFRRVTNDVEVKPGVRIRQPDGNTYSRLLGQSGSDIYTLENCFRQSYDPLRGENSQQIVHVGQALRGALFEENEAFEFNALTVRLAGMQYWVRRGAIDQTSTFAEDRTSGELDQHSLTVEPMRPKAFRGPGVLALTLAQSTGWTGDGFTHKTLSQDFPVTIQSEKLVPLEVLMAEASAIQDLVSVGLGRVAAFTQVTVARADVTELIVPDSGPVPVSMELFAPWTLQADEGLKPPFVPRFALPHLGGVAGIERWLLATAAHRSALARAMRPHYSKGSFVGEAFFAAASAVEAYDRKLGNSGSYLTRLRRTAATAGPPFADLVGDVDQWSNKVKNLRNEVAHHDPAVDGAARTHFFFGRSVHLCLVLALLNDAEAPAAAFNALAAHRDFKWIQSEIANLVRDSR